MHNVVKAGKKNILILSNYLPNQGWGGGVIIRSLIEGNPVNGNFFWTTFYVRDEDEDHKVNRIELLPFKTRHLRGRGVSEFILKIEADKFAKDFMAFLKENKIDLLWIVIGTSYDQLRLVEALSQIISIPYHVSVHDDPILEIKTAKTKKAIQLFKNILSKAASIDVISTRMQNQYAADYNVNPIVITRCIPAGFPKNDAVDPNFKTILMGGYGNASAPWPEPLIDAIEKLNSKQNFRLHLFDSKLKKFENSSVAVHDSLAESDFNLFLKTVDLGYACDDLQPENLKFTQLSLPTKIITYIGASIPFVYHGPKNSTVGDLIEAYEVGIIVENNDAEELVNAFLKLVSDYKYYQQNCQLANADRFAQEVVQKRFFDTLLTAI